VRDELIQQHRLDDVCVAVVTFTDPDRLAAYRTHLGIDFTVLTDPGREVYRQYGLGRGRWLDIYRLRTLRRYATLIRQGRRMRRPTEDTRQLGGDFVIGADGRLRYAYRPEAPDDRPPAASIIAALGDRERS
jgi:peroxiredoxin